MHLHLCQDSDTGLPCSGMLSRFWDVGAAFGLLQCQHLYAEMPTWVGLPMRAMQFDRGA